MRGGIVQFPRDARGDEVSGEENFVRFTEPVDCAVVSKVFPDFSFAFDSHSLSWLFTWLFTTRLRLRLRLRRLFYSLRVDATECVERKRERERERERERNELWSELFRYKDRSTNYFNLIKI